MCCSTFCFRATAQSQSSCIPGQICVPQQQEDPALSLPRSLPQDTGVLSQNRSQPTVYYDSAGAEGARVSENSKQQQPYFVSDPITDMQRLAETSTGQLLPIFGRNLFQQAPSTFAPADQIPSLSDYVVGPGDQLLVRLTGPESFNGQLTVDSAGSVYIPQVGGVHVAGLRADQLVKQMSASVGHTFRNFNLSVNVGRLRSVQVYVIGEARRPGAYTVSALSTILNALFVSGGPNVNGSLRHIQLRRGGQHLEEFDLYDFLLKGDKSKDMRLQSGDTIFIPPTGPQVALAGSVNHPAIYELRAGSTVGSILELAGGLTPIGLSSEISLSRIGADHARAAFTVKLDATGDSMPLRNGDVLYADHISETFAQSVTIRGNLANPGRMPWHPGMRLSEVIPDRSSLLTNDYWQERNKLGFPTPFFVPLDPRSQQGYGQQLETTSQLNQSGYSAKRPDGLSSQENLLRSVPDRTQLRGGTADEVYPLDDEAPQTSTRDILAARSRSGYTSTNEDDRTLVSRGTVADQQQAVQSGSLATQGRRTTIKMPAPEIDWSYAVIERLNPDTLRNSLVPFNLGKLVEQHDASQDLELKAGDVVTILSQTDIHVPQDEQTKYVHLEGEFKGAGVYSVGPNEKLDDLITRAGGLTDKAFLYGASFTRETARVFQQQRLDEYISQVAISMQREAAVRAASSTTGISDPNALAERKDIIAQFRTLRATGRIVLPFKPDSYGVASVPQISLEDGDVFRVPSMPATVTVIGAVHGQNVFLYTPSRRVSFYVAQAGNSLQTADKDHAFIIRADGSVLSKEHTLGPWLNKFDTALVEPGDAIVIPEKPVRPSAVRQFIDFSQIFSQLALGAAAISVIKQ